MDLLSPSLFKRLHNCMWLLLLAIDGLLVCGRPLAETDLSQTFLQTFPARELTPNELGNLHSRRWFSHHRRKAAWLRESLTYLRAYGYLTGQSLSLNGVANAMVAFQQVAGINPSGRLDRRTVQAMRIPRCGNSDFFVHNKLQTDDAKDRVKRFAQVSKWADRLSDSDVLTLKWHIQKYTKDIPKADIRQIVTKAFDLWAHQVGVPSLRTISLAFSESGSLAESDINIMWAEGDHGDAYAFDAGGNKTNILAHTFYPNYQETGTLNGDIHFDDHEKWVLDNSSSDGVHFPYVLVHEIGHALGLGHSKRQEAVMNPIYKKFSLDSIVLDIDDKCAINWNYVGPTNTCLFVWLMVELLPRAKASNSTTHGIGSVVNTTVGHDLNSANQLFSGDNLEEKLNNTLESLQGVDIPMCSEGNDVQLQYEVLLENKLDFPKESARRYGPVVCNFLDGLARMVMTKSSEEVSRSDSVDVLTVHQYPHENNGQADFMRLVRTSRRHQRQKRALDSRHRSRHATRTVFDMEYFDQQFYNNILKLVVAGGLRN